MESLTETKESIGAKKKKEPAQERITLGKNEAVKVDAWLEQIREGTNGMVNLSRSELLNYQIKKGSAFLSSSEIAEIRRDHYDEVKFVHWALNKIKEAKKSGENLTLEDLIRVQKGLLKPAKEQAPKMKSKKSDLPVASSKDGETLRQEVKEP